MEANQDDATTVNTAIDLEVESTGGTASKGKSKTSEVWTYFIDIGPNEKGKGRSQCKGCKTILLSGGKTYGTSTMRRHMKSCKLLKYQFHDISQMNFDCDGTIRSKKLDIGHAREVFAAAIVEHDCPFAFVEYPGFRKYHKLLNPDAPMISRNTVVSDINKLYLKEKNKLKQVLTSIPNRICLTSDLWTACTTEGYICLTSHFVDEKWKLNTHILNLIVQEGLKAASHTLHRIRESVKYAKSTESRMKKFQECVVEVGGIDTSIGLRLDMPKLYAKVETNPTKCQAYIEMLRKKLYKLYDQYVSAIGSSSSQPSSSTIMHSRVESQVAKKYPKRLFDDVLDVSDEIVEPVEISELDRYLEQPCYEMKFYQDLDVLDHWKGCFKGFPILSCMARDLLEIPITTIASESAFSIGARGNFLPVAAFSLMLPLWVYFVYFLCWLIPIHYVGLSYHLFPTYGH
nr:zinc finger BED domain-containing protein RICESLEEPER 2-like [Ipomoea trifida]